MTQEQIFNKMDHLVGNRMMQVNLGLQDIKDFMDVHNISLTTKVREPLEGEDPDTIENIGDTLIRTLQSLGSFLQEYRGIRETWQVTTV